MILVIDDEEAIRETLYDILTMAGHRVTVASGGREGLDYFERDRYDLVITDLRMAGMSGWDVARAVKESKPDIPVILITGLVAQLDEEKLRECKIDRVIPKPFSIDLIFKALTETLNQSS